MRAYVTIYESRGKYLADTSGEHGGGAGGLFAGLTHMEAAEFAIRQMLRYRRCRGGAKLIAPPEVLAHVPEDLREVDPS